MAGALESGFLIWKLELGYFGIGISDFGFVVPVEQKLGASPAENMALGGVSRLNAHPDSPSPRPSPAPSPRPSPGGRLAGRQSDPPWPPPPKGGTVVRPPL